jgi:hypothetical protein
LARAASWNACGRASQCKYFLYGKPAHAKGAQKALEFLT